jgi:pyrrolysyl-tRNA synthetase-like protein
VTVNWTTTQHSRLRELEADDADLERMFSEPKERDQHYQQLEKRLVEVAKARLREYREQYRRPGLCRLETRLVEMLIEQGFVQVATPTVMAGGLLKRMGIDEDHPLFTQIYWIGEGKCLRPMLAPHLYFILKDLLRLWERPIRLFEVGSCFRKESQGRQHANEFTMLNVVEMGLPLEDRKPRLERLTDAVIAAAGIRDYRLETTTSEIYGETIDVVGGRDDLELGSAAMGPHPLDAAWRLHESWVGVGFGLERLLMAAGGWSALGRLGRSISYVDGISLSV